MMISPAEEPAARRAVPATVRRVAAILVWALVLVLVLRFFSAARLILLGTLAASAVACMLRPLARRLPWSRGASAVVVGLGFVVAAAGVIGGTGWLFTRPLAEEFQHLPETRHALDDALKQWSDRLKVSPAIDSSDVFRQIGGSIGAAGDLAAGAGQVVVSVGIAVVFAFIGSIFLLAEPRSNLLDPVLPALPLRRRRQLTAALDEMEPKLRWWLIGVLCGMAIVGVVSGVGYAIAGIKFAVPLAVLAAVAELVPTVGPIVVGLLATLVASTQGGTQVTGALITWGIVQSVESYVILPLIMKRAVRVPAVVTLFSVILWGEVFGVAGLFLAIPLDLLAWTLFKHLVINNRDEGDEEASAVSREIPRGEAADREVLQAEAHPT